MDTLIHILNKDIVGIIKEFIPLTIHQKNEICKNIFVKSFLSYQKKYVNKPIKTYRIQSIEHYETYMSNILIKARSDGEALFILMKYEANYYDEFIMVIVFYGDSILENSQKIFFDNHNHDNALKKLQNKPLPKNIFINMINDKIDDEYIWLEQVPEILFLTINSSDISPIHDSDSESEDSDDSDYDSDKEDFISERR